MKKSSRKKSHHKRVSTLGIILIGVLIIAVLLRFCAHIPSNRASTLPEPTTRAYNIPFVKQGELAFISRATSDTLARIDIEVADTEFLRARGLMFRQSMPEDAGMLFLMQYEEIQGFWMRNTYISLDMLFVNADKEIVTIHAHTQTLSDRTYTSSAPALYVVEVNAGFSERNNIAVGDKISFVIDR